MTNMNKANLFSKPAFNDYQFATRGWDIEQLQAFIMYLWIYDVRPTISLIKRFDTEYNSMVNEEV